MLINSHLFSGDLKMKIEFLHTEDCHVWQKTLPLLKEAMKEDGIKDTIDVFVIKTQKDAQKHKFSGSPTIKINGEDIDPMAKKVTRYSPASCRPYFYKGKFYDYPPKEMILEALQRAMKTKYLL